MTLQEAYIAAKMSNDAYESAYLTGCADYGDFWMFSFSPEPYDPARICVGGYVKVDKGTGKARSTGFPEIMGLKSKNVPLKLLNGLIRPATTAPKKQTRIPQVAAATV